MRTGTGDLSDRLRQIVSNVIGPLSLEQAAIRANHRLSGMTIGRLKRGKPGLESTVRTFATCFFDRIGELYGPEITVRYGRCDAETAADWLAENAGFQVPGGPPAAAEGYQSRLQEAARILNALGPDRWSEEFAFAFRRVVDGQSVEVLAKLLKRQPAYVESVLGGRVPEEDTLVEWLAVIDVSEADANEVLEAAGYGRWQPYRRYLEAFRRILQEWRVDPYTAGGDYRPERDEIEQWSPKRLRDHVRLLEHYAVEESIDLQFQEQEARWLDPPRDRAAEHLGRGILRLLSEYRRPVTIRPPSELDSSEWDVVSLLHTAEADLGVNTAQDTQP